jgi:hypothetical protein
VYKLGASVAVAVAIATAVGDGAWAQDAPAAREAHEAPATAPDPAAQPPVAEVPAPTRANIVSTTSQPWDVYIDDQWVCATPCTGPLFPTQFVTLESQARRPVLLEVGRLEPGDFVVSAKPYQRGKYATGIVATTLGGMAIAIGITFLSVGLAKDRDGMTMAGAITGAAGLLTLPFGIYLTVDAVPSFRIDRAAPPAAGATAGIAGTF